MVVVAGSLATLTLLIIPKKIKEEERIQVVTFPFYLFLFLRCETFFSFLAVLALLKKLSKNYGEHPDTPFITSYLCFSLLLTMTLVWNMLQLMGQYWHVIVR